MGCTAYGLPEMRQNPSAIVPSFSAEYVPRTRFLTVNEYQRILSVLPLEQTLWLTVAVYAGCRLSELIALDWEEHVDLLARTTCDERSRVG